MNALKLVLVNCSFCALLLFIRKNF